MPTNRNALIRYKTIDTCLRNRFRQWTLEDLIDACSDALYEYEGIDKGVSKRTVQMDIQTMRSEKLGYNAPIIVIDKKYYTYEDKDYSIMNIPLTDQDLDKLSEVADILKQFKGFTHFEDLSGMVQKLENKIHVSKTNERSVIDLEKNENLKGLHHIDPIFQAIVKKKCLLISYKSFKARATQEFDFHPALLKEFRNRWFVLGQKTPDTTHFQLLALDRIHELNLLDTDCIDFDEDRLANYFKHVVGVSVNEGEEPQKVVLFIEHSNAPYVLTKPIHPSQQLIEKNDQGIVISLYIQNNFEFEREILGFGDSIKVISPPRLRSRIKSKLNHAIDLYNTELSSNVLKSFPKIYEHKGSFILNHVYTRKEVAKLGKLLLHYMRKHPQKKEVYAIRGLLQQIPEMEEILLNANLKKIIQQLGSTYFLTKALFFNKAADANWYVTWHQDKTINVKEKIETEGFSAWTKKENLYGVCPPEGILKNTITVRIHLDDTNEENGALKILAGSHKQKLNDKELKLITENSIAASCDVSAGGVHIMKPLLLHASHKTVNNKNRRVIHLEFNSLPLPSGLEWGEKLMF